MTHVWRGQLKETDLASPLSFFVILAGPDLRTPNCEFSNHQNPIQRKMLIHVAILQRGPRGPCIEALWMCSFSTKAWMFGRNSQMYLNVFEENHCANFIKFRALTTKVRMSFCYLICNSIWRALWASCRSVRRIRTAMEVARTYGFECVPSITAKLRKTETQTVWTWLKHEQMFFRWNVLYTVPSGIPCPFVDTWVRRRGNKFAVLNHCSRR